MYEYLKLGRYLGPISEDELLELADAGAIDPEAPVRTLGDLGHRPARDVVGLLRTARQVETSQPAPRLARSSLPSVGAYTVYASVPPLPPNPVPRIDRLHCPSCGTATSTRALHCVNCGAVLDKPSAGRCGHDNPSGARFCGTCGASLAP